MPSTWKTRTQTTIDFPKKKLAQCRAVNKASQGSPPTNQKQPLSPRKRLGVENLCNVPQPLECSPTKRKKENQPVALSTPRGRKLEFGESPLKPAARHRSLSTHKSPERTGCPLKKGDETPCSKNQLPAPLSPIARHLKQQGACYLQTKQVLNTAIPERLLAREHETEVISQFITNHVSEEKPGSLYVSGAPGTGKTVCVEQIIEDLKEKLGDTVVISINCMSLRSSQAIFCSIADKLIGKGKLKCARKDFPKKLQMKLTSKGPVVLLVLDEMDQLDSKAQDVLYTLFEWPCLSNSRLVLIGIANALDLTDRILPRLQARPKCKPQLLNFPPYTREQIVAIVQDRLSQVSGENVLDPAAIQFCARKVSSVSGDARKALDVCRRAVEIVESKVRNQTAAEPTIKSESPATPIQSPGLKKVGLPHISQVISEVYGDRMTSSSGSDECFPLQQKLLVCSLLLLTRESKVKEVTLGKLNDTYSRICRQHQMTGVEQSECLSLCSHLESRGILSLKRSKEARLSKVALKIEERDVEHALHDKVLMGSILQRGLP
ncbi:cell division control protein 6 homolog [Chiloscyllium plagiosum]|uniref:cell division control protein 6 homolog n=1 Tax=Chiloscyllium plagiosum TaxID=36176 RepID=UPI001CB84024|nr:cell division control protein 6 homolog [Chiloscyllium plagiosum]